MTAQTTQAFRKFQTRMMSPQDLLKMARGVPWRERPQRWWDMLAVLGGAASGGLWFPYGSIRATRFGRWFTVLLLVPFILAFVYRRKAAQFITPVWGKIQSLPLVGKVIAAIAVIAGIMMLPKKEGFDLITPLLMVAIPIALVWCAP